MKFFLTLGAAGGFCLAFFSSLHADNPAAFALRDGAIGCLVGAALLRFFHAMLFSSIRHHLQSQNAAAAARRLQSEQSGGAA